MLPISVCERLYRAVRQAAVKEWLRQRFPLHREEGLRTIVVVGTPRGGTTWLAELIALASRMRLVQEPLNLRIPLVRDKSGVKSWRELWEPEAKAKLVAYFRRIISGEFRHRDTFLIRRPMRFGLRWRTNRTVLKVIHGGVWQLGLFTEALGADVVHIVRHPIATAVSREVFPALSAFPGSRASTQIPQTVRREAERIIQIGNHLEKGVLAWALHHYPLFRCEKPTGIMRLSYEALAVDPIKVFPPLGKRLGLDLSERLRRSFRAPSLSARKSLPSKRGALSDPETVRAGLNSWKDGVADATEERLLEIPAWFGIDVYRAGETMPQPHFSVGAENPSPVAT